MADALSGWLGRWSSVDYVGGPDLRYPDEYDDDAPAAHRHHHHG